MKKQIWHLKIRNVNLFMNYFVDNPLGKDGMSFVRHAGKVVAFQTLLSAENYLENKHSDIPYRTEKIIIFDITNFLDWLCNKHPHKNLVSGEYVLDAISILIEPWIDAGGIPIILNDRLKSINFFHTKYGLDNIMDASSIDELLSVDEINSLKMFLFSCYKYFLLSIVVSVNHKN